MKLNHDQKTYLMGLLEQESEGLGKCQDVELQEEFKLIDQCQDIIQASIENKIINSISISWCADDVKQQASDMNVELTEKEIIDVLSSMKNYHDASIGINWEVIEAHINDVINERA